MPSRLRLAPFFFAFLFILTTLHLQAKNTFSAGPIAVRSSAPQQLYTRAWQLVRESYYDPTFNGQDWSKWEHKFDGKLTTTDAAYDAVQQMLGSLNDQYTRFLDPSAYKDEDDAINAIVCGIGISLKPYQKAHALIVNEVITGGPAEAAGLKYGDQIVAINGEPTVSVDTDKAAGKIRGQAGTAVQLTVKRTEATRQLTKDYKIVRRQISIPSVTTKLLRPNIGYIKLATFMADDASAEFELGLQRLSNCNGLIVDLRDNPGGLLANAVEIADMLLDRGKIVTTASRRGKFTEASSGRPVTDQPLVVIVDGDSASASEILAGALKDNRRATIIGTRTFGKGLVQEINRLPGGAGVHITVARYFTPNGSDINKVGIAPDVSVDDRDKQMAKALEILNRKTAGSNGRESILTLQSRQQPLPRTISPRL